MKPVIADVRYKPIRNMSTNPSIVGTGAQIEIRRNLFTNPTCATDTTGWLHYISVGVFTSAKVTGLTGYPNDVTTGFRATVTTGGTGVGCVYPGGSTASVTPGTTYTFSAYHKASFSSTMNHNISWYTAANALLSSSQGTTSPITAGVVSRYSVTAIAPATAAYGRLMLYPVSRTWVVGETVEATCAIIEASPALLPYFDGTNSVVERTNLATRPAPSMGGWLSNNGATHVISLDSTVTRRAGVSSRKCYYNGTAGINVSVLSLYSVGTATNAAVDRIPVIAGVPYTMSVYGKASYSNTRYQMSASFYDAGGASLGSISTGILTTTLAANTWNQFVQSNIVAPANAANCFLNFNLYTPSVQANGAQLTDFGWVTDVCFESGSVLLGDYVDGTLGSGYRWKGTANASASEKYDQDLTPSWVGTANASASVLKGLFANTFASGNTPIYSTQWSKSGTSSMRIISTYPANGSGYAEVATDTNPKGLVRGKTYTMSVVCRQIAVSSVAKFITFIGAPTVTKTIPNVAGETTEVITFTVPNAGAWYLRLYNNGARGAPDVWWDNIMIVEGIYTGSYADGSSTGWAWEGAANASASIGYGKA